MPFRLFCFFLISTFLFPCNSVLSQNTNSTDYLRFIDSADVRLSNQPKIALQFLDSIPLPLEKYIKGHLSDYYKMKALVSENLGQETELFQNFLLALQYAEKEKKYDIAGFASRELFYNLYITKKDSLAYTYLNKAEQYYIKTNNNYGLLDVMQTPALVEFYHGNFEKSNKLILPKLDYYKSIKEDAYYYMYPLFMLTSNYIHLEDQPNSRKYYSLFKELENDSTIPKRLYKRHEVTLLTCMAESYVITKELDSAKYYFSEAGKLRHYMNSADVKNYFNYYIEYYKLKKDDKAQNNYIDSLEIYQNKLIDKAMDANFNVSQSLVETNENLLNESKVKKINRIWVFVLTTLLIGLMVLVLFRYKQIKEKFQEFSKRKKDFEFLESNHEKLQVKMQGLEAYILELKKEVKVISSCKDTKEQQEKIKELYKKIYHNSATLLSEGKNHLELINGLNVDFFNRINSKHPELNHAEAIICYYIFTGFKNKEIAAFLNTSERAVESKRYRIGKKMNLQEKKTTLVDYLQQF